MTVPLQGGQTPASRKTMIVVKNQGAVGDADLLLYPLLALLCNRRPNKSVREKGRRTRKSSQGFRFVQILVDEKPRCCFFSIKLKLKERTRRKKNKLILLSDVYVVQYSLAMSLFSRILVKGQELLLCVHIIYGKPL